MDIETLAKKGSKSYSEYAAKYLKLCDSDKSLISTFWIKHFVYCHETIGSDGLYGFIQWQQAYWIDELITAYKRHDYNNCSAQLKKLKSMLMSMHKDDVTEICLRIKDDTLSFEMNRLDELNEIIFKERSKLGHKNGEDIFNDG